MPTAVRRIVLALVAALVLAAAMPLAAATDAPRYRIEASVRCGGELRAQPRLILAAGEPESFEVEADDRRWRLSVEVEEPSATEGANPDALWLRVGIEEWIEGEWDPLTDTMIGTPLGRPGRVSVADPGEEDLPSSEVSLYVELVATRID